jgi:phenylalanyl-tRNA synthetase beta chain
MRASLSWLKEYVAIEMSIDRLVESLTMIGLEVDSVTDRYDYLDNVVVGRILEVTPHPKADKLSLCDVDIGQQTLSVVCGAPNAEKGLLGAVALPGTVFPDGTVLKKSVIRGSASEGMLCSESELGLGRSSSGIMVLQNQVSAGQPLAQALELSDTVIEIDLTPNRADCLSLIGIAREIAGIQKTSLKYPDTQLIDSGNAIADLSSVTIEAPEYCPRYAARLLTGVTVGPSPFWLQERLLSIGLRPINNIVDVTNFVMMELGQPLHAFDFDQLAGHRIVVRTAKEGEVFTTLDEKERKLTPDMLMICDAEKAVAVGGVMGGLNSEIESSTSRVLLESAYFNPISIRRTAKQLGMTTEASYRFERGVDPQGTVAALNRAAKLIADVSGASLVEGLIDAHPKPSENTVIGFGIKETNRLLGTTFSIEETEMMLRSIGFETEPDGEDHVSVITPSFRVDVKRPEDLMEEVARLSGYDNIPLTYPTVPARGRPQLRSLTLRNRIKQLMTGYGFHEIITYSFINDNANDKLRLKKEDKRRRTVPILNPLSEEQAVMRSSLLPGMLETMRYSVARHEKNLKLFEIGKIFYSNGNDSLPKEVEILSGLWCGSRCIDSWHARETACDFFDLKGAVEAMLVKLGIDDAAFEGSPEEDCTYTRPGYSARIRINDQEVGMIGEVHPQVRENFDLKETAYIFELIVDNLRDLIPDAKSYQPIPRYPSVSRDVTLIVDLGIESGRIINRVEKSNEGLIEKVQLFDVFDGKPIPSGKKSISFRIVYRSSERTLEDEEINRLHQEITGNLLEEFKALLPA